jgi:adenosylcobinamide kinase/adenosylcobinamide-phosphate guanylyltransferase
MAEIVLITGGARSGKSRYAQELAEAYSGQKLFVATCPIIDPEMEERIKRHCEDRVRKGWQTVEEGFDLADVLASHQAREVVLIDCLTLWINNLLFDTEAGKEVNEDSISALSRKTINACMKRKGIVLIVTNEVGMGIVPENALARRYRDLVGRCNQEFASAASKVVQLVCGIPITIKEITN